MRSGFKCAGKKGASSAGNVWHSPASDSSAGIRTSALMTSLVSVLVLSACVDGGALTEENRNRMQARAEAPTKSAIGSDRGAVLSVETLETSGLEIRPMVELQSDYFPPLLVGPFDFQDDPVDLIIQQIGWDVGITVDIDPGMEPRAVTLVASEKMLLKDAIELLAANAGLYYSFSNNVLRLHDLKAFSVQVPTVAENFDNVVSVVEQLGGKVLATDQSNSTVTFTAPPKSYEQIEGYLGSISSANNMIIYDTWVHEVVLDDNMDVGVNFEDLAATLFNGSTSLSLAGGSIATPGNFALGVISSPKNGTINAVLDFLKTVGSVRTLAKPQLSVMSGRSALFRVGETQKYIDQITNNLNTEGDPTSTEVTTQDLETGLRLDLTGIYAGGVVFTEVAMDMANLVQFAEFDTGSTRLSLPHTSERQLATSLTARPGDIIMMAGIIADRDEQQDRGLPLVNLKTESNRVTQRSEIILMMRPRVIEFRAKAPGGSPSAASDSEPGGLTVFGSGPAGG